MSDGTPAQSPPRVFISYSHDSDAHRKRVLALSERLREDGIDADLDQYVKGTPPEKWPRWMLNRLDWADFVLLVCTSTYYRRFRGHEEPGKGKGVDWEGAVITDAIYDDRSATLKFVPVLFDPAEQRSIPEPARGHSFFCLTSEIGYRGLYDFLLGQSGTEPRPLGQLKRKARDRTAPRAFPGTEGKPTQETAATTAPKKSEAWGKRGGRPPRGPGVGLPDEVQLGASTPRFVSPGGTFVARFAAYTDSYRCEIKRILRLEAPLSQQRLDLDTCRWHRNTKVTVRLEANGAQVSNPVQSFSWNGSWQILRFDVHVLEKIVARTLVLRFDVAVEGLPVVAIRPEVDVLNDKQPAFVSSESLFVEEAAPKSAFASYATDDRREVLGRVRSVQIFTGIDVFLDCLSLRPGDEWKPKLHTEINNRDIFWLFWSRHAKESKWVDWEWRTALDLKTLAGIQPHPLEPMELAPPPKELSNLQFGTLYEWYTSQLRESWFSSYLRILTHRAALVFLNLLRQMGLRP